MGWVIFCAEDGTYHEGEGEWTAFLGDAETYASQEAALLAIANDLDPENICGLSAIDETTLRREAHDPVAAELEEARSVHDIDSARRERAARLLMQPKDGER